MDIVEFNSNKFKPIMIYEKGDIDINELLYLDNLKDSNQNKNKVKSFMPIPQMHVNQM